MALVPILYWGFERIRRFWPIIRKTCWVQVQSFWPVEAHLDGQWCKICPKLSCNEKRVLLEVCLGKIAKWPLPIHCTHRQKPKKYRSWAIFAEKKLRIFAAFFPKILLDFFFNICPEKISQNKYSFLLQFFARFARKNKNNTNRGFYLSRAQIMHDSWPIIN